MQPSSAKYCTIRRSAGINTRSMSPAARLQSGFAWHGCNVSQAESLAASVQRISVEIEAMDGHDSDEQGIGSRRVRGERLRTEQELQANNVQ
jgi:hypothetical protein